MRLSLVADHNVVECVPMAPHDQETTVEGLLEAFDGGNDRHRPCFGRYAARMMLSAPWDQKNWNMLP